VKNRPRLTFAFSYMWVSLVIYLFIFPFWV